MYENGSNFLIHCVIDGLRSMGDPVNLANGYPYPLQRSNILSKDDGSDSNINTPRLQQTCCRRASYYAVVLGGDSTTIDRYVDLINLSAIFIILFNMK
ncbi:hypothetical protein U1Q18_050996 [Sarracenia purpurea var. burkii]